MIELVDNKNKLEFDTPPLLEVDKTLTKEGAAADAKEVGDRLKNCGTTPDWVQNEPTEKDYIKNRTHYTEETEVPYIQFPFDKFLPDIEGYQLDYKLPLILGETYNLHIEYNGEIIEDTAVALDGTEIGFPIENTIILQFDNSGIQVFVGVGVNTEGSPIADENSTLYGMGLPPEITMQLSGKKAVPEGHPSENLSSIVEVIHKLNGKFLDYSINELEANKPISPMGARMIADTATQEALTTFQVGSENIQSAVIEERHIGYKAVNMEHLQPLSEKIFPDYVANSITVNQKEVYEIRVPRAKAYDMTAPIYYKIYIPDEGKGQKEDIVYPLELSWKKYVQTWDYTWEDIEIRPFQYKNPLILTTRKAVNEFANGSPAIAYIKIEPFTASTVNMTVKIVCSHIYQQNTRDIVDEYYTIEDCYVLNPEYEKYGTPNGIDALMRDGKLFCSRMGGFPIGTTVTAYYRKEPQENA